MNIFIKKILFFFLFLVIFYPIVLFLWGSYTASSIFPNLISCHGEYSLSHTRFKEAQNFDDVDVLFLGSSHTYRGFDPRIFEKEGIKSFNLGSSSQTPLQTKVLLNRYLEQLNPKLVIYEVYPGTFCIDGVESSLDIILNDENDFNSIKMALFINNIKVYNALIYSIIRDMIGLTSDYNNRPLADGVDHYISGGFVEREIQFNKKINYKSQNWVINEKQIDVFKKNIDYIKERNIKVVLVQAPITQSLYKSYSNNNTFDSLMNSFSEYYNFNDIICLDDSLHFYDNNHLNKIGVELFDNTLINVFKENSFFPQKLY